MRKFKDSIAYGWRETCKEVSFFDVAAVLLAVFILAVGSV